MVVLFCPGVSAAANDYGVNRQASIADSLYYQTGGGSIIILALTRRNSQLNKRTGKLEH